MPASKRHRRAIAIRRSQRRSGRTPSVQADPNPAELPDLATQRSFTPRNQRPEHTGDWRTETRHQYGDHR